MTNKVIDNRVINAVIRWKDSKKTEDVRIALYPYQGDDDDLSDDDIFFYCDGEDDFIKLLNVFNGQDFEVIWFETFEDEEETASIMRAESMGV